jgi:glycerophosphoryl diester phosphodiesterase
MGQTIVAHRGASHDAPENTLAAFKLAWEKGADAIEGDFYLTKDGQIVCIHDETTRRTGSANLRVAHSTLNELRALEVGSWKDSRWKDERIPTLREVLATVPRGKRLLIEIKCGVEIVLPLKKVLMKSRLRRGQVAIIAFSADVIAACKRALPKIPAFWLTSFKKDSSGAWQPSLASVLQTLGRIRADGLDCKAHEVVDAAFVRQLRKRKLEFHVWTVDDPEVARRFKALGVDSITTNRPAFLREALDE